MNNATMSPMKSFTALLLSMLAVPAFGGAPEKPVSSAADAQFRRWFISYLSKQNADDDVQNLVYGYALVDLNGDGRNEAVAWARDSRICGTGGCDLEVFVRKASGWKLFSSTTITRPPVQVLTTRSHGWRDLAALQAGGGIVRSYEARLRFNGKKYETVEAADWTGQKQPPRLQGRIIISDATIPLSPGKCRPTKEAPSVFGPLPIKSGKPGSC